MIYNYHDEEIMVACPKLRERVLIERRIATRMAS